MDPARVEHVKELARGWVEEGVHPALVVLAARRRRHLPARSLGPA